jgi:hypothetical protein
VFRGDDIRDNEGNLAVLLESKVNPTGMAGINANLAYGSLPGHKTTQSDVVRAYLQSWLGTKVPTWVELSPERFLMSSNISSDHVSDFGGPHTATQKLGIVGI